MTTDAAVAEPEVVQAEVAAPETQEAPPTQGDAASPNADAGSAESQAAPTDVDAAFEAYKQKQKEGEPEQPEARAAEPQVDPEVLRQAEEARIRFQNAHRTRQERLDDLAVKVEAGDISYAEAMRQSKAILNEHHADSLRDAGWQSAYEQNAQFWRGVEAGIPQELHPTILQKLEQGKYGSYKDAVSDLYAMGEAKGESKGYSKGVEAGFKDGYREGLARSAAVASLSSDGQGVNGTGGGSGSWSTKTQARNLHATGKLSNQRMREINADPSIPE